MSIRKFSTESNTFTYCALRNIRSRCKENGFETAFIKVGKRVLIDVEEFWRCALNESKSVKKKKQLEV